MFFKESGPKIDNFNKSQKFRKFALENGKDETEQVRIGHSDPGHICHTYRPQRQSKHLGQRRENSRKHQHTGLQQLLGLHP